MRALVWMMAVMASVPAWATDGLAWSWEDGETRRYLVQSATELPEGMPMYGTQNRDAVAVSVTTTAVISCAKTGTLGKRGVVLRCDIDNAAIGASGTTSTADLIDGVAADWAAQLSEAWLEIEQHTDGRLLAVDLEGIDTSRKRLQANASAMRLLMMRALAPLDLRLPKKGDDGGRGAWQQSGGQAMSYPSVRGSAGSSKLTHTVAAEQGPVVVIGTEGTGSIAPGDQLMEEGLRNVFMVDLAGSARFDRSVGALTEAQFVAEGKPTASSVVAEGRSTNYTQRAVVKLVGDEEIELLDQGSFDDGRGRR